MNQEHPLHDIIATPDDAETQEAFGQAVRRGMKRAVCARRHRRALVVALCPAVLIAAFILALNSSPAFAMAIGHVPGLRQIAQLVTFDKGLKKALENEYFQPVGQAVEKDGITVNIGGIMADDGALTIFWDATGALDDVIMYPRVAILDEAGNSLPRGVTASSDAAEDGTRWIQVSLPLPPLPDSIVLELSLYRMTRPPQPELPGETPDVPPSELINTFTFPIAIDRSIRKPSQEYAINKSLQLTPGAAVTVEKLVVYPTHARLFYHENAGNTEDVKYLSLRLVNERGEVFQAVTGIMGTMESTFFSQSKHLTLEIDKVSTLPKGVQTADLDPKTGAVSGPAARWLMPLSVEYSDGAIYLAYTILPELVLDTGLYDPFVDIIKDDGGNVVPNSGTGSYFKDGKPVYTLVIKDQPIVGLLHVELGMGPPVAVQGGKIEIK